MDVAELMEQHLTGEIEVVDRQAPQEFDVCTKSTGELAPAGRGRPATSRNSSSTRVAIAICSQRRDPPVVYIFIVSPAGKRAAYCLGGADGGG